MRLSGGITSSIQVQEQLEKLQSSSLQHAFDNEAPAHVADKHASVAHHGPSSFDNFVKFLFEGTTNFASYDKTKRLNEAPTLSEQRLAGSAGSPVAEVSS